MKVEDVAKLVTCGRCLGEGQIMTYPHYCIPMPDLVKEKCQVCRGAGKLLLVSGEVSTVRDTSF